MGVSFVHVFTLPTSDILLCHFFPSEDSSAIAMIKIVSHTRPLLCQNFNVHGYFAHMHTNVSMQTETLHAGCREHVCSSMLHLVPRLSQVCSDVQMYPGAVDTNACTDKFWIKAFTTLKGWPLLMSWTAQGGFFWITLAGICHSASADGVGQWPPANLVGEVCGFAMTRFSLCRHLCLAASERQDAHLPKHLLEKSIDCRSFSVFLAVVSFSTAKLARAGGREGGGDTLGRPHQQSTPVAISHWPQTISAAACCGCQEARCPCWKCLALCSGWSQQCLMYFCNADSSAQGRAGNEEFWENKNLILSLLKLQCSSECQIAK